MLASTIIGIMAYLTRLDHSIELKDDPNYQYIRVHYASLASALAEVIDGIQEMAPDRAREYVIDLYRRCESEFNIKEMQFILTQTLALTRHQAFLITDIEDFYKELLFISGHGELGIEEKISDYRVKWMR